LRRGRPTDPEGVPGARRRQIRACLLVIYVGIAGVFPPVHAAAEQAVGTSAPREESAPELPAGHNHLTCHACAAPVSLPAGELVTVSRAREIPQPRLLPLRVLPFAPDWSWYRDGIPPRAPPIR
jgi:hypothetical protein